VGQIVHKAVIDIDEEGAEASGATVVTMIRG
jgi:serine protease inhibitor